MTRHRSAHQDVVLFGEDLYDLHAFYLHTLSAHTACHANTLHYTGCIGRVTQRTRSTLTVMLTVRLLPYAMEVVTFNNTLETFTFRSTYYFNFITFGKDLYGNGVTEIL